MSDLDATPFGDYYNLLSNPEQRFETRNCCWAFGRTSWFCVHTLVVVWQEWGVLSFSFSFSFFQFFFSLKFRSWVLYCCPICPGWCHLLDAEKMSTSCSSISMCRYLQRLTWTVQNFERNGQLELKVNDWGRTKIIVPSVECNLNSPKAWAWCISVVWGDKRYWYYDTTSTSLLLLLL